MHLFCVFFFFFLSYGNSILHILSVKLTNSSFYNILCNGVIFGWMIDDFPAINQSKIEIKYQVV